MSPSISEGLRPAPPEPTSTVAVSLQIEVSVPQSSSFVSRLETLKEIVQSLEGDERIDGLYIGEVRLTR